MDKKTIFILLLFTILITSCIGKKEASCPSFDIETAEEKKEKKRSKYRILILKDGKRINGKKGRKKSKNRLFKKKMY
ncbi:hypothetical protein OAJ56_00065 [Flavobacteriales bacterium]|nr:hypothetical protein [Flavobacteriales bacterium]